MSFTRPMPSALRKPLKSAGIFNCAAALLFAAALSAPSQAAPLYYSDMPRVSTPYDSVLSKTWQGIKKRNVDAYTTGLVHRPKSEYPGDAVSEGVSYGMFLALYSHDQAYFNKIWDAGEKYMWNSGGYYDWNRNSQGGNIGVNEYPDGPASDADQDIALLLIFADELVKAGIWQNYTSMRNVTYAQRAASMMPNLLAMTAKREGSDNRYLRPGGWGGVNHLNPGYFAPAFYRIFAEFDPGNAAAWNALVEGSYEVIENSPGYGKGLLPDWCGWNGDFTSGGAGYNGYRGGIYQYRDAIRVYWRLATDYLWYGEPRAKAFLDNAVKFLGSPDKANFFNMAGNLPPEADGEMLKGGTIPRTRREHSHLTLGMWAAAAMGSGGPALAQSYSDLLLQKFYADGRDFFGQINIPAATLDSLIIVKDSDASAKLLNVQFAEDTLRNEMYFDQFLAWFGASILGGRFTNVWADLKGGVPQGPPAWKTRPAISHKDIDASVEPLRVTASFTRSVRWTAVFTHDLSDSSVSLSANSDTINFQWYGLSGAGAFMPQGMYTLTVSAAGIDQPYRVKVWLGRAANVNLMEGHRLLVDDFADGDSIPYIGNGWVNFLDSYFGKPGRSTAQIAVKRGGDGKNRLNWTYLLNGGEQLGYDPHAGLEWNCGSLNLRGIDTLIITARVADGTQGVSVQLVSSDFNFPGEYQYYSDSITLNTTEREYLLPLSNFKQRGAGGSSKDFNTTLSTMTGIRFQVQEPDGSAGTIIVARMYFTGDVSGIYKVPPTPPAYIPPDGEIPDRVTHRSNPAGKYSIKRSGNAVRVTLPPDMAGANARIVDIRGRVVRRMNVPPTAQLNISARGLAAGMYFVEIRKPGATNLRFSLGNVR